MFSRIFIALVLVCAGSVIYAAGMTFSGDVKLIETEEDFVTKYRVAKEFFYEQSDGRIWIIPEGAVIDGRSFPRLFLDRFQETPNPNFLKSSVSYDFATKSKHHPWEASQMMFYEAAQLEGVSREDANEMYLLLFATGSRWAIAGPSNCFSRCHGPNAKLEWRPMVRDEDVLALVEWARDPNRTPEEIRLEASSIIQQAGPHSSIPIR